MAGTGVLVGVGVGVLVAMAVGVGVSVVVGVLVGTDVRVGLRVGTAVCANVPVAEGSVPAVGTVSRPWRAPGHRQPLLPTPVAR